MAMTDQGQIESGISSALKLSSAHDKIKIDIQDAEGDAKPKGRVWGALVPIL